MEKNVKIENQIRDAVAARKYSPKTADAYVSWYKQFVAINI